MNQFAPVFFTQEVRALIGEALACPKCGASNDTHFMMHHMKKSYLYRLECSSCIYHGPDAQTQQQAIKSWNEGRP